MSRSVEIIRQKRREAEAAAKEAARRKAEEQRQRQLDEQRGQIEATKRDQQDRERQIRINTQIAKESGVLRELQAIKDAELHGVKSALVYDMDEGRIELAWGRTFEVSGNRITGVHGRQKDSWGNKLSFEEKDYSYIEVLLSHPEEGSISISSELLFRDEWRANPNVVPEALAKAFLFPSRMSWTANNESISRSIARNAEESSKCCS